MLDGATVDDHPINDDDVRAALRAELAAGSSTRDAAAVVAKDVGRPKREVYALALGLGRERDDRDRDDRERDDGETDGDE